jgi:hypothetical protein
MYLIFLQRKPLKVEVCYHYYNPELGCIVVYNQNKNRYIDVHVEVFNESKMRFIYHFEEILPKVGCLLNFQHENDIEGNRFFGLV